MEAEKIDQFLLANEHKFPDYKIPVHRLLGLAPEKEALLANTHFNSPGTLLLASIFFGFLGVDRFLLSDRVKGFAKLGITAFILTWFLVAPYTNIAGLPNGLGCVFIVDWFLIMGATKKKNLEILERILE